LFFHSCFKVTDCCSPLSLYYPLIAVLYYTHAAPQVLEALRCYFFGSACATVFSPNRFFLRAIALLRLTCLISAIVDNSLAS